MRTSGRSSDRYTSTGMLPRVIPVFPLGGAILLPRATLPLNIFEPRYLELFDEAMSGARIVGIIQPARDASEGESPDGRVVPLRHVGCAGRVTAYQELDDGRLIVGLSGIVRFAVGSEVASGKQYRTCAVTYDTYFIQEAGFCFLTWALFFATLKWLEKPAVPNAT